MLLRSQRLLEFLIASIDYRYDAQVLYSSI